MPSLLSQAQNILACIAILKTHQQDVHPLAPKERNTLMQFCGFGKIALHLFPDPVTGTYKEPRWQTLGEYLVTLLTPEEYSSARRSVFTAFYTAPCVIECLYAALKQLGVPDNAIVLEPGCGTGHFLSKAPPAMRFVGIECDLISGLIAQKLYPQYDIHIEDFRQSVLGIDQFDAVLANPPFADLSTTYWGQQLALHELFLAKALDALKPGGIVTMVMTHYLLDKTNVAFREQLAQRATFVGEIGRAHV